MYISLTLEAWIYANKLYCIIATERVVVPIRSLRKPKITTQTEK
jgi:hypothetical protein